MGNKLVVCFARDDGHARPAIEEIKNSGFAPGQVSLLFSEHGRGNAASPLSGNKPQMGGKNGFEGAASDLFSLAGTFAIPGIGSVTTSGPVFAGLANGSCRGLSDALVAAGVPSNTARQLEACVKNGGALIAIQSDDPRITDRALGIFEHSHLAHIICLDGDEEQERNKIDSF